MLGCEFTAIRQNTAMSSLAAFSQHMSRILPTIGSAEFAPSLANALETLVLANDFTFIVYVGQKAPKIDHFVLPNHCHSLLDLYCKGAFLIDPFYLIGSKEKQYGFFTLAELAPPGFKNSEYYRTWYRHTGLKNECGYVINIANGFINISIGHNGEGEKFNKSHRQLLRDIEPLITTMCQLHYGQPFTRTPATSLGCNDETLRLQLQTALDGFGRSVLTDRECQIVNMLMHGHSTKSIAELLCISTETVKLHRKKSYAKLDINSQSELFYLFIDSLMSVKGYEGGDTLSNYL